MINLSTIQEQGLLPDIIDDTNPDDVFVGFFRFSRDTNPNYCLIKRIVKENGVTKVMYPNGQFDYSCNWENRAAYSYRHRDFPLTSVRYGYLYIWETVTDSRQLSASGWRIPSLSDFDTLSTYLGGNSVSGGKLKETENIFWDSPNTGATNEFGFNARGVGYRQTDGQFVQRLRMLIFTTTHSKNGNIIISYNNAVMGGSSSSVRGFSIRLIKENSENPGIYIGNDGRAYRTVKIGEQVWLADNLAETKYRNGDPIPTVTDNAAWAALTTGAKCAYNNDESYV